MAFQIKDFASIILGMVNRAKATQDKITDFRVGSVARTMFESPAAEIDELYQQMWIGLKEAIPVAIYTSFSFDRLPAKPANGLIRVTISSSASSLTIPAGTSFSNPTTPVRFTSTLDTTIAAGDTYADIYVAAQTSGSSTNIAAGLPFSMTPSPAGFLSAVNAMAFSNGVNLESDDQRKWRFASYIASLNHGTKESLLYALRSSDLKNTAGLVTEYVKLASVYEPYVHDNALMVSWVRCFIHNGTTGASNELIARALDVVNGYYDTNGTPVPGWKAAGVKVDVEAATNVAVNVTAVITPLSGYSSSSLITQVNAAIQAYLFGLGIGVSALKAEIIAAAMSIDGVYNFEMSAPTTDTAATYSQKIVPGTISIT